METNGQNTASYDSFQVQAARKEQKLKSDLKVSSGSSGDNAAPKRKRSGKVIPKGNQAIKTVTKSGSKRSSRPEEISSLIEILDDEIPAISEQRSSRSSIHSPRDQRDDMKITKRKRSNRKGSTNKTSADRTPCSPNIDYDSHTNVATFSNNSSPTISRFETNAAAAVSTKPRSKIRRTSIAEKGGEPRESNQVSEFRTNSSNKKQEKIIPFKKCIEAKKRPKTASKNSNRSPADRKNIDRHESSLDLTANSSMAATAKSNLQNKNVRMPKKKSLEHAIKDNKGSKIQQDSSRSNPEDLAQSSGKKRNLHSKRKTASEAQPSQSSTAHLEGHNVKKKRRISSESHTLSRNSFGELHESNSSPVDRSGSPRQLLDSPISPIQTSAHQNEISKKETKKLAASIGSTTNNSKTIKKGVTPSVKDTKRAIVKMGNGKRRGTVTTTAKRAIAKTKKNGKSKAKIGDKKRKMTVRRQTKTGTKKKRDLRKRAAAKPKNKAKAANKEKRTVAKQKRVTTK